MELGFRHPRRIEDYCEAGRRLVRLPKNIREEVSTLVVNDESRFAD
jgi:hypothetical protein